MASVDTIFRFTSSWLPPANEAVFDSDREGHMSGGPDNSLKPWETTGTCG